MNEAGNGVVAHAAAAEREGGVSKGQCLDAGQADIDGFGLHVEALLGYAGGVGPQILVGLGAAVAANNLDFGAGVAGGARQVEQDVEDARIVMMNGAGYAVAQEMVELGEGLGEERLIPFVNDVNMFAGVGFIQAEAAFLGPRGCGKQDWLRRDCRQEEKPGGKLHYFYYIRSGGNTPCG